MLEAPPPSGEIVVNLVADFVCPWCFIGATRLDQAVAALSEKGQKASVKVVHQPFLLDPSTPPKGAISGSTSPRSTAATPRRCSRG
jgi:predicted DsbA family dithiol-disulfide isomerase